MSYQVDFTLAAEKDLEEIYDYIAGHDSSEKAEQLLEDLLELTEGLSVYPERGSYPKELLALGIREYRQILFHPNRLIYRVIGTRVLVYLVVDGRRDFQSLLERRLFEF